jgi:hypothetical protein
MPTEFRHFCEALSSAVLYGCGDRIEAAPHLLLLLFSLSFDSQVVLFDPEVYAASKIVGAAKAKLAHSKVTVQRNWHAMNAIENSDEHEQINVSYLCAILVHPCWKMLLAFLRRSKQLSLATAEF